MERTDGTGEAAYRALGLGAQATEAEVRDAFTAQRAHLQAQLDTAATPRLAEIYAQALRNLVAAYEHIQLAHDARWLEPLRAGMAAEPTAPEAPLPPAAPASPAPSVDPVSRGAAPTTIAAVATEPASAPSPAPTAIPSPGHATPQVPSSSGSPLGSERGRAPREVTWQEILPLALVAMAIVGGALTGGVLWVRGRLPHASAATPTPAPELREPRAAEPDAPPVARASVDVRASPAIPESPGIPERRADKAQEQTPAKTDGGKEATDTAAPTRIRSKDVDGVRFVALDDTTDLGVITIHGIDHYDSGINIDGSTRTMRPVEGARMFDISTTATANDWFLWESTGAPLGSVVVYQNFTDARTLTSMGMVCVAAPGTTAIDVAVVARPTDERTRALAAAFLAKVLSRTMNDSQLASAIALIRRLDPARAADYVGWLWHQVDRAADDTGIEKGTAAQAAVCAYELSGFKNGERIAALAADGSMQVPVAVAMCAIEHPPRAAVAIIVAAACREELAPEAMATLLAGLRRCAPADHRDIASTWLAGPDPKRRAAAAASFAEAGAADPEAAKLISAALESASEFGEDELSLFTSLERLDPREHLRIAQAWLADKDADEERIKAVADSLARTKTTDARTAGMLAAALLDEDRAITDRQVLDDLAQIDRAAYERVAVAWLGRADWPTRASAFASLADHPGRHDAAAALMEADLADPGDEPQDYPALLSALDRVDAAAHERVCLSWLGSSADEAQIGAAAEALAASPKPANRKRHAEALVAALPRVADAGCLGQIFHALAAIDPIAHRRVALGMLRDASADGDHRGAAAESLGRVKPVVGEAIPLVVADLQTAGNDEGARDLLLDALAAMDDARYRHLLLEWMRPEQTGRHVVAAQRLARLAPLEPTTATLITALLSGKTELSDDEDALLAALAEVDAAAADAIRQGLTTKPPAAGADK